MRIRRKKWARPELEACAYFVKKPEEYKNHWREQFNEKLPLFLELGCGKGGFISRKLAEDEPINYVAVDVKSEMLAWTRRKIEAALSDAGIESRRIRLMAKDIENIDDVFGEDDAVERIYINFCNPWPKAKHKKRRLTSVKLLRKYAAFCADGARLFFKTDDDELFEESLEYFREAGYETEYICRDIARISGYEDVETEHEKMFKDAGKTIKFAAAVIKRSGGVEI